jgi:hypothetical protein
MRPFGAERGSCSWARFALAPEACSSGNGDGPAEGAAPPGSNDPTSAGGCGDAAGLTGAIEDRGMAEASGGAVRLGSSESAFLATCTTTRGRWQRDDDLSA